MSSHVQPPGNTVKVTFMNRQTRRNRRGYTCEHGQTVRSALPRGEVARCGRRTLDAPHRARPAAGPRAIPGSPCPAVRYPAETPGRPPAANGAAGTGGAHALLEAPATRFVRPHRPRARVGSRSGRAGDVGPAVRGSEIGPSACDVRTPDRAAALLPAL